MVIAAMVHAMPGIANVALLVLFTFFVFGILGIQLFKGMFVRCNDPSVLHLADCTGNFTQTTEYYEAANGAAIATKMVYNEVVSRAWDHSFFNFNHLGMALLTLLQQMFSDGWSVVLYDGMDSTSYDEALQPNARPYMAIYFVVFAIVGNFFLINLFVGSLIDSFSHERNKAQGKIDQLGNPLLTEEQDSWIRSFKIISATTLLPAIAKPMNPLRAFCCWIFFSTDDRLVTSLKFEYFITAAIGVNTIFMMSLHSDQPAYWDATLFYTNLIFAVIFLVEAIIKISALLPTSYFADSWNRFDFLMVPIAFVAIFLGGPGYNALRVLRVARVLRLVKRAKGLRRLFDSLMFALPPLMNISLLLVLTLFVFGVVGTTFFGSVYIDPNSTTNFVLTEYFNFRNAGNSMVLLFQISTTESWSDVMQACMITPHNSGCRYENGDCGTWLSIPYFIMFMMIANSIALNLFIFVVVDNYMEVRQTTDKESQRLFMTLSAFRTQWSLLDRDATHLLKWDAFLVILRRTLRDGLRQQEGGSDDESGSEDEEYDEREGIKMARSNMETIEADAMAVGAARRPSRVGASSPGASSPGAESAASPDDGSPRSTATEENSHNNVINVLRKSGDANFMRRLNAMDISVDRQGMVRYDDCVYGITKEFYRLDDGLSSQATRFLHLSKDEDPTNFANCFKVHHALAVRKIMRLLQQRKHEQKLARGVHTKLTGMLERKRAAARDRAAAAQVRRVVAAARRDELEDEGGEQQCRSAHRTPQDMALPFTVPAVEHEEAHHHPEMMSPQLLAQQRNSSNASERRRRRDSSGGNSNASSQGSAVAVKPTAQSPGSARSPLAAPAFDDDDDDDDVADPTQY
jgi:hypothetical protein